MVKKLTVSLIIVLLGFSGYASHYSNGEIFYRYIGDSTGIPYHYQITIHYYRNTNGNPLSSPTSDICFSSSCFSFNRTIALPKVFPPPSQAHPLDANGGWLIKDRPGGECSPNPLSISKHIFRGTVILDGPCSDWKFIASPPCCRDASDNLVSPNQENLFLEATLNNMYGPNSSPVFSFTHNISLCLPDSTNREPYSWKQFYEEQDGDSLYFFFSPSQSGPNCGPGSDIAFVPPLTYNSPLPTYQGIQIDQNNGTITFIPTQIGKYTVKFAVNEYRYDSILNDHILIGSISIETGIVIDANCPTNVFDWTIKNHPTDSTSNAERLLCGDSIISIKTTRPFNCTSLSPDGSDFVLLRSDSSIVPIKAVSTSCDPYNYSDTISLLLNDTLNFSDTLRLYSKMGNDGNSLISSCGIEISNNDSTFFYVKDCSGIGLNKYKKAKREINIYPNPANNQLNIFIPEITVHEQLTITDIKGTVIISDILEKKTELDISYLAKGVYFVKVQSDDHPPLISRFTKN